MKAQDVLDFWFLPAGSKGHGQARQEWFRKDERFDEQVRTRFGSLIPQAVAGGLRDWDLDGPRGTLARIIVLDQFTRNVYRGTPGAFEGDALALAGARHLVHSGAERALTPVERWFAYMPFEHTEDARTQKQSVELFAALAREHAGFDGALDYAHRHRGVIARFGRFPHRNAILGRASTLDEIAFLGQHGSGF
jgi:uncharacterized protein (DUF924 family)